MDNDFNFDYGVIEFKHRFSLSRNLGDYAVTVLDKCISVSLVYKYYTMACDKLIAEIQVIHRVSPTETNLTKFDLHDFTFKVKHKGDMCISL